MPWAGEVSFLVRSYYRTFPWTEKTNNPGVAANRAIQATRRRLPKGTRVDEIRVTLRRLAPVPPAEEG